MCNFSLAVHQLLSVSCSMLVAQPGEPSSYNVAVITIKYKYSVHITNENKYREMQIFTTKLTATHLIMSLFLTTFVFFDKPENMTLVVCWN